MRRFYYCSILAIVLALPLWAHFQMVIPSRDIVDDPANSTIAVNLIFCHPFEGDVLNMVKPVRFGVMIKGEENEDLTGKIAEYKIDDMLAWQTSYKIKRPGDYLFYVEPAPYWEPAEQKFIVHYTKVCVNGFGLQEGWDREIGLETEIVPLTRPYGLYAGNVFAGLVLLNGKPAPSTEVEVEYYNREEKYHAPSDPYVTQVVKTDANGVFYYAMPRPGWWGFAALSEREIRLRHPVDKKDYPVEIGAVIWVKTEEMK